MCYYVFQFKTEEESLDDVTFTFHLSCFRLVLSFGSNAPAPALALASPSPATAVAAAYFSSTRSGFPALAVRTTEDSFSLLLLQAVCPLSNKKKKLKCEAAQASHFSFRDFFMHFINFYFSMCVFSFVLIQFYG